MLCELLGGALVGNFTIQPGNPRLGTSINNMLMIALNPDLFGGTAGFQEEVELFIEYVKATPAAEGHEEVLMAGEPEQKTLEIRMVKGIPIDDNSWKDLLSAAQKARLSARRIDEILED